MSQAVQKTAILETMRATLPKVSKVQHLLNNCVYCLVWYDAFSHGKWKCFYCVFVQTKHCADYAYVQYVHSYVHSIHIHSYVRTYVRACICMYIHMHACTQRQTRIHTHTRTHTHMHIYIQMDIPKTYQHTPVYFCFQIFLSSGTKLCAWS